MITIGNVVLERPAQSVVLKVCISRGIVYKDVEKCIEKRRRKKVFTNGKSFTKLDDSN